jgi:hypothetical protein
LGPDRRPLRPQEHGSPSDGSRRPLRGCSRSGPDTVAIGRGPLPDRLCRWQPICHHGAGGSETPAMSTEHSAIGSDRRWIMGPLVGAVLVTWVGIRYICPRRPPQCLPRHPANLPGPGDGPPTRAVVTSCGNCGLPGIPQLAGLLLVIEAIANVSAPRPPVLGSQDHRRRFSLSFVTRRLPLELIPRLAPCYSFV